MENHTPRVFVSYSHDHTAHKKWVAELATKLVGKGVDVILDQWDLRYGDDVPKFMEKGVREVDRVLMICSEPYVHKANEGQGGVGYEAMIVTGELVRDLGTSKFIPIIKQDSSSPQLPTSVSTRLYINLSNEEAFDEQFEKLLRELHETPVVRKPTLGQNPFQTIAQADGALPLECNLPVAGQLPIVSLSTAIEDWTIQQIYENGLITAQNEDFVQWKKLVQRARSDVNEAIIEWRNTYEQTLPMVWSEILPIAVSGAATYAPLIAIALAGVESRRAKFNSQQAILDDILYPRNWNRAGRTILADFPTTLAFVYQGLHGSVCLATAQLDIAIKLIRTPIEFPGLRESIPFWQHHHVMGWPQAFEGTCTTGWDTLSKLPEQWTWLDGIFGDVDEYKAALCAYYMALNVFEYIDTIATGDLKALSEGNITLDIPLCFESMNDDIKRRGYRLLTANPEAITRLWRDRGIEDKIVKQYWASWINVCRSWLGNVYSFRLTGKVTHNKLLDEILS